MCVMLLLDGLLLTDTEDFVVLGNGGGSDTDFECTFRMPLGQIDRLKGRHRITVGVEEQVHRLQLIGYESEGEKALVHAVLLAQSRALTPPPQS